MKEKTYVVVVIDVVDGKLSDGNDSGGIVGTDNGGNPLNSKLQKKFTKNCLKHFLKNILPGDVYDGIAGIPAATGGTAVNVELGSVLTTLIKVSI